ncbi:hypothetical protein N9B14_00890 [Akkermansiaceae bacterium]|nr:hypothetical protein [Akkermansiaceae bacterium]
MPNNVKPKNTNDNKARKQIMRTYKYEKDLPTSRKEPIPKNNFTNKPKYGFIE